MSDPAETQTPVEAEADASGLVTFKLTVPVVMGSQTIDEFVLQPMNAKMVRGIPKDAGVLDEHLLVLARRSGHSPAVIDRLCWADSKKLLTLVAAGL